MILKKCRKCESYNLTKTCRKCKSETEDAHYKFIKVRDETRNFNRLKKR